MRFQYNSNHFYLYRTLTYCLWSLISGDDEEDIRPPERIALPPPAKRRDYHLRMFANLIDENLIEDFFL